MDIFLTNYPLLWQQAKVFKGLVRSDHLAVTLLPVTPAKPERKYVSFRDVREHPLFSRPSNVTTLETEFYPLVAIKEESFPIGRQILHAFKQIWELVVICITGAMLSGIIIWFLVGIQNSLFPQFIPSEKLIIQMIYVTQVSAKSTIKKSRIIHPHNFSFYDNNIRSL